MSITATADPLFMPPRVQVDVALPAGSTMQTAAVYRRQGSTRELIRQQPSTGLDQRTVYDYEAPYGVAVSYEWESAYTDALALVQDWTEAWANTNAWTKVGASWSVSGGKLVWTAGDSLAATITRAVTAGKHQIVFAAPPVGLSSIDFGGFTIDVINSRLIVGGFSTPFTAGTTTWTIDVTPSTVNITTSAGSYSVTGNVSVTQVKMIGAVSKIDWVRKWGSAGAGNGQFSLPSGIARDSAGYVYVADFSRNIIQKFTAAGVYVTQWGSAGTGNGQFNGIYDICVDGSDNIFAVEKLGNRVQKFTPGATPSDPHVYSTKWGSVGTGNSQFGNGTATAITADSAGSIYVVESGSNTRVQKFSNSGTYTTQWGTQGTGNGQFLSPSGITADTSNNIYVVDGSRYDVQKFTSTGTYSTKWGSSGTGAGQFQSTAGIACDGLAILVVDQAGNRVHKFNLTGGYITTFGSTGTGDGQFRSPWRITATVALAYIVDADNHRVQQFSFTSTSVDDVTVKSYGAPATIAEATPTLTVDSDQAYLIHPSNPAKSFPLSYEDLEASTLAVLGDMVQPANATVHRIIGTSKAIPVTSGPRWGDRFALSIGTETVADRKALSLLLADQTAVLLRVPPAWDIDLDEGFYSVGDVTIERALQLYGQPARMFTLPMEAVESPAVTLQNVGWSWAGLLNELATWATVYDAYGTWADVLTDDRRTGF